MKHTSDKPAARTEIRLKRTSFKRGFHILCATILIAWNGFSQAEDDSGLTFDFKDVPLSMVLDYFSETAGFVIMTEVDVSGSISVYTRQPLNEDEAVETLNAILNERGYAAVRKGLILKIVSAEQARTENLPVRRGASPESIPENDAMVTQVIPVSYTEAGQLLEDLEPLIPEGATITSNTSSNAIVITDTQNNIRRLASIVAALDTSISDIAQLKVYPLAHADAVEIAEIVEDLFERDDDDRDRRRRGRDDDRDSSDSAALQAVGRIVSTADEYTNSLVVSAPPVAIAAIDQLVEEMDVNLSESTELELVTLQNADATETAQILNDLVNGEGEESEQQFGGFFGRRRGDRDDDRRRRREDEQSSDRIQAQNSA